MKDKVLAAVAAELRAGGAGYLYTLIDGEYAGSKAYFGAARVCNNDDLLPLFEQLRQSRPQPDGVIDSVAGHVFCERIQPRPRLCICGGGHVSLPLAQIADMLGFAVTVLDDREEFANARRFPQAELYCGDFVSGLQAFGGGSNDYFVIITSGHLHDRACLEQILRGKYAYVGMIGSRPKRKAVYEQMLAQGFTQAQLDTVHSPIGLNIGAETPAEIAVCIAAEIIEVKSRIGGVGWEPALLEALQAQQKPAALVVIVDQRGSSPRGVGARMLVRADGSIAGTVGGGSSEAEAIRAAVKIADAGGSGVFHCDMTNTSAVEQGMVCGGTIDVFIEAI
ncbi:MAG: XdhC family protein [Bacillota bacterium]|nr:XdhC family protein [Bacillota bacterium]